MRKVEGLQRAFLAVSLALGIAMSTSCTLVISATAVRILSAVTLCQSSVPPPLLKGIASSFSPVMVSHSEMQSRSMSSKMEVRDASCTFGRGLAVYLLSGSLAGKCPGDRVLVRETFSRCTLIDGAGVMGGVAMGGGGLAVGEGGMGPRALGCCWQDRLGSGVPLGVSGLLVASGHLSLESLCGW